MQPRYPIYVPSKGRWQRRPTIRRLEEMGVPFTVVVEQQEREAYAAVVRGGDVVALDPGYQHEYDPCVELRPGQSKGSGPARNFIWDHAVAAGAERHWVLDDNITAFYRRHAGERFPVRDGVFFRIMEDFVDRYENVALAAPQYSTFDRGNPLGPFVMNSRVYSCILVRNDLPLRWRGRYNEDTDLSLRALKAGWCTVLFYALQANKTATQQMAGGNTDEIYADGTTAKSLMLLRLHPDVVKPSYRWGREHHYVDYRRFRQRLVRRPDVQVPDGDPYGLRLVDRSTEGST